MKKHMLNLKYYLFLVLTGMYMVAQAEDNPKARINASVGYLVSNNKMPAVIVKAKSKVNGRFQPVAHVPFKVYLGEDATGALIATVLTNDNGEAEANIPATLKEKWGTDPHHKFYAAFDGNDKYNATSADLTVSRARLLVDTSEGRKVVVTLESLKDDKWIPVKDVDVKIGIKRLGADLNISDKQNYTTDSLGKVSADFTKDSMPGDAKGNIILIAKVEDNEQFGSLNTEKLVPWGKYYKQINTFGRRTLYATRGKSPIWLVFMAYSIMLTVWGILILLIYNLFTIKKLGKQAHKSI